MPVTVRNNDILFNNGTTQSTAVVVDTTAVLNATAGLGIGAVGSYAILMIFQGFNASNGGLYAPGATIGASNLRYANLNAQGHFGGAAPAGTWRILGWLAAPAGFYGESLAGNGTLCLRIS